MIRRPQLNGDNDLSGIEKKLYLKELELTALTEVTQAINANLSEDQLYRIFHFTLISNLHIPKLALFVLDKDWNCKVSYNTRLDYKSVSLSQKIREINRTTLLHDVEQEFKEFNIVLPISHKSNVLAYVLVGGIENAEQYLQSATIPFIQTLASIIIVAIENKKLVRRQLQQEALRKELEIARDVQSMLFPKKLPKNDQLTIRAFYLPHQSIGGDYYDYIALDKDRFIICIGDVSGKGVPAALLMSNVQACLRTLVRQTTDLKEIIHELNYCILNNAKGERFITFFIACCNLATREINYINAGHNPSILVSENHEVMLLEKGTTVLGAFNKLPFIEENTIAIPDKSIHFTYTDGLTETNNKEGEEFGLDNVKNIVSRNFSQDPDTLHELIRSKLDEYRGSESLADDITFLSCSFS